MARLLAVIAALAVTSPAFADEKDKPKPNTLTPKEIADGWMLLFDGESTFGWKIDGAAEVKDGVLILGKGKMTTAIFTPLYSFTGKCDIQMEWIGKGVVRAGISLNAFDVPSDKEEWGGFKATDDGLKLTNTSYRNRGTFNVQKRQPSEAFIKIETDGKNWAGLRSIKFRPSETAALFTGKSLEGWKVNAADPKRMVSKWDVTKDGELSVKSGPGDLVSEKEFDNFVLQFECKTLGKALNSGVFFRCVPGQYQNGYEAQIQNSFKDDDRTKPADFGTGAIYRRIPARKVVSNDNEWFTMTVVADGKHISTWVNGYQTVDWTDDRKENDNPRQGYRAAKGPLSIQGHDPTTDILFRNIRIAELPAAKK